MRVPGNARHSDGHVEIDGVYIGGYIRPANRVEDRIDRRLAEHQTGKRRVVVALRERGGRTFTHVAKQEAEGVKIASETVEDDAVIYADEAPHWDALHARWPVKRINHSLAYSDLNGTNTNLVESFFSRLRRMVAQHHHASARYLHQYANHAAWLEDRRRMDNGALCHRALGLALAHPRQPGLEGLLAARNSVKGILYARQAARTAYGSLCQFPMQI